MLEYEFKIPEYEIKIDNFDNEALKKYNLMVENLLSKVNIESIEEISQDLSSTKSIELTEVSVLPKII